MKDAKYFLITDSHADEVEALTGLRGRDTPFGVLVEQPKPFRLEVAMERFERAFHPNRCTCGRGAIFHRSGCPAECLT